MRSGDQYEVPVGRSLLGLVCAAVLMWLGALFLAGCKIPPINIPTPPTTTTTTTTTLPPPTPPPVTLPDPQPFLDDTKLTERPGDMAPRQFPTVNAAVQSYQQHEPTHWNPELTRLTVPVATGYLRLSAWLRPTIAAQSVSAEGQASDAIFVCDAGSRCEEWHVFASNAQWANTTGAMKGAWTYGAPAEPPVDLSPLPDRSSLRINVGGLYPCTLVGDDGLPHDGTCRDATVLAVGSADRCLAYGYTDGRQNCAMGADVTPQRWGRERYAFGQDDGKAQPPDQPGPAVCNALPAGARAYPNAANWIQCGCIAGQCSQVQICTKDRQTCGKFEGV